MTDVTPSSSKSPASSSNSPGSNPQALPAGWMPQVTNPPALEGASIDSQKQRERMLVLASVVKDIDHTLLKQDSSTRDNIKKLCNEALQAQDLIGVGPKSVCVNSSDVAYAAGLLKDSGILVCSVIGFPLGKMLTEAKVFETKAAIDQGASEIDMVINVAALKSGRTDYVKNEIYQIANACHEKGAILKVIIEACNLTDAEKVTACQLSEIAGADFVKTSTGFEKGGATFADVALMRKSVSPHIQVKAAGGMKTVEDALEMRKNGADRFGTSGLLPAILAEVSGKKADNKGSSY